MIADADIYDDEMRPGDAKALWAAVMHQTLIDAVEGVSFPGASPDPTVRLRLTTEARNYLTRPNSDFNEVCYLAGLDPVAVRERATQLIAAAPLPEELFKQIPKPAKHLTHGGETHSLSVWARIVGIPANLIRYRLTAGWSVEEALMTPARSKRGTEAEAATDHHAPGVVSNFAEEVGTGAGSTAQEIPDIDFHKDTDDADRIG